MRIFAETLKRVRKGGFVYLDPPYDPVSDTASFTGYNKGGFDRNEQIRLKQCCDELTRRGVKFMLSNSATEFIKELYGEYEITIVKRNEQLTLMQASVEPSRRCLSGIMGLNDTAWENLFDKYHILAEIERNGQFTISANQIKEFREPRLMTKFDHKVNLPTIFAENQLAILPVTRGDYGYLVIFSIQRV